MDSILIVEDDITLNNTLTDNLTRDGFVVSCGYTLHESTQKIKTEKLDLVILDINLPDGSGFDLCDMIRTESIAILFLTANDLETDMIKGYNLGADDYVTKPFSYSILKHKIIAILNRLTRKSQDDTYSDGHLKVDFTALTASVDSTIIDFTPLEFQLLSYMIKNSGHILTRQQILAKLWDSRGDFVDESSLNSIVSRIRKKIDTSSQRYIRTVYGTGYIWTGGKADAY